METHNQQGAGTRGAGRKFAPAGTLRGNGTEAARELARERVRAALKGATLSEKEMVDQLDGKPLTILEKFLVRSHRELSAAGEADFFATVTRDEAMLIRSLRAQPAEPWKPKKGDLYFFVDGYGCALGTKWFDAPLDKRRLEFGNCFRTYAEAEAARERVRAALKGGAR